MVLADNKYDNILNIDVLEETLKERDIRKNMLKFKVDKKRESIKKFVEVVQDVQRRSSIVTELLNCISPTKQSQKSIVQKIQGKIQSIALPLPMTSEREMSSN